MTYTHSQLEEFVVAALLDPVNRGKPWPPYISTCLACAERGEWENPVATRLARAIGRSASNPTQANIATKLSPQDALWLLHPTYKANGLFLETVEGWAQELCVGYKRRRLIATIHRALFEIKDRPDKQRDTVQKLIEALGEFV